MLRKIWRRILKNISKSLAASVEIAALSSLTQKLRRKNSLSLLTWSYQQVKYPDYLQRMKKKHSSEMLELIMLNNSKEQIHLQANSILTLLTESEIIFTFVCVSLQLVKSSETDSENSPPYSMSVRLIGFFLGPKRLLFQWLNLSSKNSKNLIHKRKQRINWWSIWVMFTWWSLIFVTSISQEWEDRFISLLSHI